MARAKNTSRASVRRRSRAAVRAEQGAVEQAERAAVEREAAANTSADPGAAVRPRPSLFRLPNFRQDLRDLPRIMTSRPAMAVAPAILLIGFVLQLANARGVLPTEAGVPIPFVGWISFAELGDLYVQILFLPPALLTFFLAGYIAPRASYLVGALLGAFSGALWTILIVLSPVPTDGLDPAADFGFFVFRVFVINILYGAFAAAFAAWYRDFLRRMRETSLARRSEREVQQRAKRREQRQEDRRAVKRTR